MRRNQEFWRFHRGKLATLGYPLNRARLAAHVVFYVLDRVLNPKRITEAALRVLRHNL